MTRTGDHPAPETLASFAEGRVDAATRLEVLAHLETCTACMDDVEAANQTIAEESAPARRAISPWWIAAAAAAAIALFLVPFLGRRARSPVAQLAALLPDDVRPVEPRLSGGFAHAPYRGPMRGNEADARQLVGKAGELDAAARKDPSAGAQHAAGVALILIGAPDEAIARLVAARAKDPADPKTWSDLAAAQYAEALRSARASLYPQALASADRALELDPKLAEARFNRALILERMGVVQEARAEWEQYLALDATSPWAAEARQRLAKLRQQTSDTEFRKELPRLERAVRARDGEAVRAFVQQYPQQSRAWGEGEWLGLWGESGAEEPLELARAVGGVLRDRLLQDAVTAIVTGTPEQRRTLAAAHVTYRKGRVAYSRAQPEEGEALLREAARGFASGGSPMALMARYYAACARFDRHDRAAAIRELEQLLGESRYAALAAHVRWELGLALMTDGDWNGALPLLSQSAAGFRALGERSNTAFVETLLADVLVPLGRPDDSWTARIRSFAVQSGEGRGTRLAVSLGAAARMEMSVGHDDAARALLALERRATVATGNDALLADVLVREAVLAAKLGGDAPAALREVERVAGRIADPALRARALADADFAAGAVALRTEPRVAAQRLTRAIDAYRARQLPFYLPEALLLRARTAREGAARDLEDGIAEVERHRGVFAGTGVLDAGNALYEEAIALSLDRGEVAKAFLYAERGRSTAPVVTLEELQARLRGSGTAVLEIATLPAELVSFFITADEVAFARHPIDRDGIAALDERKLYDLLVRPAERLLARTNRLIVVADRPLAPVSFAALHDGRRALVERLTVAVAASASSLHVRPPRSAPKALLALALPPDGARGAALPESAAEVDDVRRLYPRATVSEGMTFGAFGAAAREADVVHIAGHTGRTGGVGDAALTFSERAVSWSAIAATPLRHAPVVVLAACETLRLPPRTDARALSLGGGFSAAGASDVIGTLTPIADVDARELFREVHRQLATGVDPVDAVCAMQRREVAREAAGERSAWRSIALLTSRIPKGGS